MGHVILGQSSKSFAEATYAMDDLHRIEVRLGGQMVNRSDYQQWVRPGDPGDPEAEGKLLPSGTAEHGGGSGRCEGAGGSRWKIYGGVYCRCSTSNRGQRHVAANFLLPQFDHVGVFGIWGCTWSLGDVQGKVPCSLCYLLILRRLTLAGGNRWSAMKEAWTVQKDGMR